MSAAEEDFTEVKIVPNKDYYLSNPLIHKRRRLSDSPSKWISSFGCEDMKPLIICRGPIRKEAMDVFAEMGIEDFGILLSEKDSITYTNALAPELRTLTNPDRIHRVPDYTGASKEERIQRIQQIIQIAHDNGYNSVFAGYGFMAEDEEMVKSMEQAGLNFIGPCSKTVHDAGLKDEAKRTALSVGVSVTPGIDNATTLALLKKHPDVSAMKKLAADQNLAVNVDLDSTELSLENKAVAILAASYDKGIDLYTIEEVSEQVVLGVSKMYQEYPQNRIRLKAIGGGGGKGQRILLSPDYYEGSLEERIKLAAEKAPEMVREILNEVKTTGVGDNKNIIVELNIETTRHQEIQVVGNGDWCITLGGRDCSLQMHEQKLLEVSVIKEDLEEAETVAKNAGKDNEVKVLQQDIKTLAVMESEASCFGEAVGLDSVSTFECIVDRDKHFFMEMNTRIQVEHRVTELCYGLTFSNPEDASESFSVESLVELMVLLACHPQQLPKPERYVRNNASVEARLNATNHALQPHAGGVIKKWSNPIEGEIRDDQGISMHNPDTDVFMKYRLAGAYDSNVALLLSVGEDRLSTYEKMSDILRRTVLKGADLHTNLEFHYGLVNWFIGNNINARPTTRFIVPYLTAVGLLKEQANQVDLTYAYSKISAQLLASCGEDNAATQAMQTTLDRKRSLLIRPIEKLFDQPHVLAGWLSLHRDSFSIDNGKVTWRENPIKMLADTYHYLNMDFKKNAPAAYVVWSHDNDLLQNALAFYSSLEEKLNICDFVELHAVLQNEEAPKGFDTEQWQASRAAHAGYQSGTEIFNLLPYISEATNYFALKVNENLTIEIPENLTNDDLQTKMAKVLVPPPVANSDEILAASGGMYYPREAPGMDCFISEGDHFNQGDPLYIVEVMKMFNKVYAPFSGTIDKILAEGDGVIISKGQALFKITPDEIVIVETPQEIKDRKQGYTDKFLSKAI